MEKGRKRERERVREEERKHGKLGLRFHDKFVPRHVRLHPRIEGDDNDQHVTDS